MDENNNVGKGKKGSWGYERHIVQCPACGRDILDHMTRCPFCDAEVEVGGPKPMSEATLRRVKLIALIVGAAIALAIVIPLLIKKFGG